MRHLQLLSDDDLAGLSSLLDNPISLNDATESDLWFLSASLVAAIVSAKGAVNFRDWADVARRTALPLAAINALRPFFRLPDPDQLEAHISTRVTATGSDERLRTRLNLSSGSWQAQWVLQRDPEEYNLADLSALSLSLRRDWGQVVLGTHRMNWGLGLVLAGEFATPRGEALLRPVSRLVRLRTGFSNSNIGTLQGAAADIQWERLRLVAGTSARQTDITRGPGGAPRVVAYRTHDAPAATTGETLHYLATTTTVLGTRVGGLVSRYHLQATAETDLLRDMIYSLVIQREYQGQLGAWQATHEQALRTTSTGPARGQNASQTRLTFASPRGPGRAQLRLALMYRRYPPGWTPLRGRAVGRRVSRGNESGWFFGWRLSRSRLRVHGYLDLYQQREAESAGGWHRGGSEWGLTATASKRPAEVSAYYRQREEVSTSTVLDGRGLEVVAQQLARSHYASLTWAHAWSAAISTRLIARVNVFPQNGQVLWGRATGGRLLLRIRSASSLALGLHTYRSDGWEQRVTIYEDGLPGEFNLRALSGRGVRVHTRWGLTIGKGELSIRAAWQWQRSSSDTAVLERTVQTGLQMDVAL